MSFKSWLVRHHLIPSYSSNARSAVRSSTPTVNSSRFASLSRTIKRKPQRAIALISLILLIILAPTYFFLLKPKNVEAAWFNSSWGFRSAIQIGNSAGSALTNYQIKALNNYDMSAAVTAGKVQADFDDIRFTDINGKLLPYWIEDSTGSSLDVWIKMASVPTSGVTVYLYYGNPSAVSASDISWMPTGGTITSISGYRVHTFTTDGTFITSANVNTEVLVVAGGGGGGGSTSSLGGGGGGGAGGLIYNSSFAVTPQSYPVTVGIGGSAVTNARGISGTDSIFSSLTAIGGGGGGAGNGGSSTGGLSGGCGGGAGYKNYTLSTVGTGTSGQGNDGGQNGATSWAGGGGGGGAGTAGGTGRINHAGGIGGSGISYSISGTSVTYAVGGTGGTISQAGVVGAINTGNGGGGGYATSTSSAGGSGVVIIRYPSASSPVVNSPATEEIGAGPVAYWSFDEGVGGSAFDSTANNNRGTLGTGSSSPAWQTEDQCVSGKCLFFDGSNDKIDITSSNSLKITSNLTMEAWVKIPSTTTGGIILRKVYSYEIMADYNNSGKLGVLIGNGTAWSAGDIKEGSTTIDDNQWHHVAVVYNDTANSIILYVDGKEDLNTSYTVSLGTNNGNIAIGYEIGGGSPTYFKGFIDEPRIYSYARSAAQIKSDYISRGSPAGASVVIASETKQSLSNGLVGYWKLDEIAGTTAADSSGNNNVGTWYSAPETGTAEAASTNLTIVNAGNSALSTGNSAYNGMIITITGGVGCGVTANTERTITNYDGTAKSISVGNSFAAETDNCDFLIKHQIGGKFGNGAAFDGSSNYVNVGTNNILNPTAAYTIGMWVKLNTVTPTFQVLLARNSSGNHGYELVANTSRAYIRLNPSKTFSTATNFFTVGEWVHVIYTFSDNDDKVRIYKNGSLYQEWTTTELAYDASGMTTAIGRWGGGNAYFTNGLLDEVRIYNRALSPVEVSQLYNWAPGPLGYWKLDEKTGSTAYDSSGNSLSGSLVNSPQWTTGKYGGAINVKGLNKYANVGTTSRLELIKYGQQAATFEAWFWSEDNPGTGYDGWIIDKKGWDGNGSGYTFNIYNGLAALRFRDDSNNQISITSTASVIDSRWHHVAISIDRASTNYKVYLDGKLDKNSSFTQISTISNSANPFYIGYTPSITLTNNFILDEVKVYNYARSAKQVVEDMNAGHPNVGSPIASQVGYWNFDEGFGTTVNNSGFIGSTANGTFGAGSSAPTWTNDGKIGKALNFSGTVGSVVSAPSFSCITITGTYSISAWIKPTASGTLFQQSLSASDRHGIVIGSGGSISYGYYNGASWIGASGTVTMNQWNHVIGINDSGNLKLFVNTMLQSGTAVPYVSTGNVFYLGRRTLTYDDFDGLIDEVKIYNSALTAEEIKLDYNQGSALVLGANSSSSGNTASSFASSQDYCIPGDTAPCGSPVGEWKTDEKSGTIINDSTGNGNSGSFGTGNSAPTWTVGKFGSGLRFNGSNNYVSMGDTLDMGLNGLTISAWIKTSDTSGNTLGIAGKPFYGSKAGRYSLYISSNILRMLTQSTGSNFIANSTIAVNDNQWHYVVGVVSRTGGNSVYVDSILTGTAPGDTSAESWDTSDVFSIGIYNGGGRVFNGLIDQVRIYNYARTPAQIAWDYNRGGPVGYWEFDECQGSAAQDSSGIGNSGSINIGLSGTQTMLGTCASANTASAWSNGASGKYSGSLNFDGVDDYINNNTQLVSAYPFTMSAWIKKTTAAAQSIFSLQDKDATSIQYGIFSSNYAVARSRNTTGKDATSLSQVNDGNWHLITGIFVNDTSRKIYVDGKFEAENTESATYNSAVDSWDIGRFGDSTPNGYFSGQIDDVRIYNYALTSEQVKLLYNANSSVNYGN